MYEAVMRFACDSAVPDAFGHVVRCLGPTLMLEGVGPDLGCWFLKSGHGRAVRFSSRQQAELAQDAVMATDPPVSEAQRRAMWAAASGHSKLGIPKSVGEKFVGKGHDEGDDLGEFLKSKGLSDKDVELVYGMIEKMHEGEKDKSEESEDQSRSERESMSDVISHEYHRGHPLKQAIAIAYSKWRHGDL